MPLVLTLKMVSDKEYPRVHTNRQHVLASINLTEGFLIDNPGYLPVVLVYGRKLDHGGFPVAAIIGDVIPGFTTNCRFIIVLAARLVLKYNYEPCINVMKSRTKTNHPKGHL